MKILRYAALAAIAVVGCAVDASATPIQWNFSNVQFQGPGCPTQCKNNTLTGFFTFDATLNVVSHFDVLVTGTGVTANHEYKSVDLGGVDGAFYSGVPAVNFFTPGFVQFLNLNLGAPLTNAGGTVNLLTASFACPGCGVLTSGEVTTAAPVPEPATMTLLGTALAGLAVRRRRRQ